MHRVALPQARAGRRILVDDGPARLVEDAEQPAAANIALQAGALEAIEGAVQAHAGERRYRDALWRARDADRALLVDGLRAPVDRDEQHAGEEASGRRQRHAEDAEAALAPARLRRLGHARACSASKRCNSGSPFSGNGTSTLSKSRGTSVRSKIARASSRISPPA